MTCVSTAPNNYGSSNWVAGQLPIRYQLESTRWPVNSEDDVDFFHAVSQNGAYAQIELAGTYELYINKEYIVITDSTVSSYNGVWQILAVDNPATPQKLTISAPYNGDGNGNVQRYYNNYRILVRVYTGIPSGHYLEAQRPMAERTILSITPDSDNEAEVDVGSVVRGDLTPIQSQLCDVIEAGQTIGNDWYNWTAFYIEYAEQYDKSDGNVVTTYTSSYTTDQDGGNINYYYASNSTKQFQDFTGWSMGQYALADYNTLLNAKFLTLFTRPRYFDGEEFDLAILSTYDSDDLTGKSLFAEITEYDSGGTEINSADVNFPTHDAGFYRIALSEYVFQTETSYFTVRCRLNDGVNTVDLSELITIDRDTTSCGESPIYLRWQNYLGGWDSWLFTAYQDFGIESKGKRLIRRDVSDNWDTVFRTGDTEDDWISGEYYNTVTVRSQVLTKEQVDTIYKWIRLSVKVYEVFFADDAGCGNYKQRTVLVEDGSFTVRQQRTKFHEIAFKFRRTDPVRVPFQ